MNAAQIFARLCAGKQQVQRLRRGDEDVRRRFEHGHTLFLQRVAGAHAGANLRDEVTLFECKLQDFRKRRFQVLLHVVGERL